MLNKEKHQQVLIYLLKDIYSDPALASRLGFKGGTCGYFFYNLPRFSVDLDFDLIEPGQAEEVKDRLTTILSKHGTIKDSFVKYNTIFFLLSYGDKDHNVKVEVSYRTLPYNLKDKFELREYLGISVLAAKPEYLFAGKISALLGRHELAMRDVFDTYFYAKQKLSIDEEVLQYWSKKNMAESLSEAIKKIQGAEDRFILQGLGELIDEKQKTWVKENLKKEAIIHLEVLESIYRGVAERSQ